MNNIHRAYAPSPAFWWIAFAILASVLYFILAANQCASEESGTFISVPPAATVHTVPPKAPS